MIKVGDYSYVVGRLNAFQQFDVARKWASILFLIGGDKDRTPVADPSAFSRAFLSVSSQVPKEDNDMAMRLCLSVVTRQVAGGGGMAPVLSPDGALMFVDIDMLQMIELCGHVLVAHKILDVFYAPPATTAKDPPLG